MVYGVECVEMALGSEIAEASSVVQLIHGEMEQIPPRHHHRRPTFPSH